MLRRRLRENLKDLRSSLVALGNYALSEAYHGRDFRRHCQGKNGLLLNIGCGQLMLDAGAMAFRFQAAALAIFVANTVW